MSEQEGSQASRELNRKTEITMLEKNLDFMSAQKIVLQKDLQLLRTFVEEIIGKQAILDFLT